MSICARHLLRNKWPTKDNLVCRGTILVDAQMCVSGCGNNETTDHLLIHYPIFSVLWQHVKAWIGFHSVEPQHILDHFTQFTYSTGSFKPRWSFLQLVWLCSVYVLGMKGIIDCSLIKLNLLCSFWRESKLLLFIG